MAQAPLPASAAANNADDPSMDDILASIRRILNDDDKTPKISPDGVLMLDPSMIVDDDVRPGGEPEVIGMPMSADNSEIDALLNAARQHKAAEAQGNAMDEEPVHRDAEIGIAPPHPALDVPPTASSLVAPAAAAAAASSVSTLMRTLAAERSAAISRGSVTIEDVVREEVRPVLKAWLDTHLPPLVERLVQAEIERVVGRITG